MTPAAHSNLRVGIDVTDVDDVAASVERFGDRYLRRIYTDHELATCAGAPERLAARFAAKEAVVKVLRPTDVRPEWRSIEIRSAANGATDLHLTGEAARQAAAAHLTDLAVSLTHEGPLAAAVVVANVAPQETS